MFKNISKKESKLVKEQGTLRKAYLKPQLKKLGDLRAITLGGTTAGADYSGPQTGPYNPNI